MLIIVSGVFIGMVLGLQGLSGSDHLQRGDQSWHVEWRFCCAKEGGAGGRGVAVCQAGRVGVDGGNRPDAGDGAALQCYGDDGGRSIAPGDFAALLGERVISLPLLTIIFVAVGIWGGSLVA